MVQTLSYDDRYVLFLERHIILVALQSLNMWFGHQYIHRDPVFLKEMMSARFLIVPFCMMSIFGATLNTTIDNHWERFITYLSFAIIAGFTNALILLGHDINDIYQAIIISFGICGFFVALSLTRIASPFSRWINLRFRRKIENANV